MTTITIRHWETGELYSVTTATPALDVEAQAARGTSVFIENADGVECEIPNDHIVAVTETHGLEDNRLWQAIEQARLSELSDRQIEWLMQAAANGALGKVIRAVDEYVIVVETPREWGTTLRLLDGEAHEEMKVEIFTHPLRDRAEVNWQAIGSVEPAVARAAAFLLEQAASIAELFIVA
jgi:hypothetical protein